MPPAYLAGMFIAMFSLFNRGRGSHFWNIVNSTIASRVFAAAGMSIGIYAVSGNPILLGGMFLSFLFWMVFGWDNYWSAAIGNYYYPQKNTFAPADFLLRRMPWFKTLYRYPVQGIRGRLWGTVAMGLRGGMTLLPGFAVIGYFENEAAFWMMPLGFLQGIPYLICGLPNDKGYSIPRAEYLWGAMLGVMYWASLKGVTLCWISCS